MCFFVFDREFVHNLSFDNLCVHLTLIVYCNYLNVHFANVIILTTFFCSFFFFHLRIVERNTSEFFSHPKTQEKMFEMVFFNCDQCHMYQGILADRAPGCGGMIIYVRACSKRVDQKNKLHFIMKTTDYSFQMSFSRCPLPQSPPSFKATCNCKAKVPCQIQLTNSLPRN